MGSPQTSSQASRSPDPVLRSHAAGSRPVPGSEPAWAVLYSLPDTTVPTLPAACEGELYLEKGVNGCLAMLSARAVTPLSCGE